MPHPSPQCSLPHIPTLFHTSEAPFKAIAAKKAAAAIRGFEGEVSLDNWKAVCALPGVGKGTQDKVRTLGRLQLLVVPHVWGRVR